MTKAARHLATIAILGACLLLATEVPGGRAASAGPHFTIEPGAVRSFGRGSYEMGVIGFFDQAGTVFGSVRSELRFPLDVFGAGVAVGLKPALENSNRWSLDAIIERSFTDPTARMTDRDWFSVPDYGIRNLEVSHTTSESKMTSVGLSLRGYKSLGRPDRARPGVSAGVDYYRAEQDIIGFEGWQLDENRQRTPVSMRDTTAMTYRATYTMLHAGLGGQFPLAPGLVMRITADPAFVFASDFDDHRLRFKTGSASGTGFGFLSALNLWYQFGQERPGWRPHVSLRGEYRTLHADTKQTQRWYGNDPITAEDETGMVIRNVPHKITAGTFRLGLALGVSL